MLWGSVDYISKIFLSFWQTRACRHFSTLFRYNFFFLFLDSIYLNFAYFYWDEFNSIWFENKKISIFISFLRFFCYLVSKSSQNVFECSFIPLLDFFLQIQMHIFYAIFLNAIFHAFFITTKNFKYFITFLLKSRFWLSLDIFIIHKKNFYKKIFSLVRFLILFNIVHSSYADRNELTDQLHNHVRGARVRKKMRKKLSVWLA